MTTRLDGLRHALSCLGETRCSDREGHALAEKALAAAIAEAGAGPRVVTAEEVHRALRDPSSVPGYTAGYGDEAVAVLVNARIAAAVEAARAEERESCALAFAEAAEMAVPAPLDEVERLEAKAEAYKRDWYAAKSEFGTTVARLRAWERDARAAMERLEEACRLETPRCVAVNDALPALRAVLADAPKEKP